LLNFKKNAPLSAKIIPHNYGLSLKSERRQLQYSAVLKGKNSTQVEHTGNEVIELKEAYKVLDELIGANNQERFFIKMDCEGAEFEIFNSLESKRIHEQIFGFIIEWHFKDPQPIIDVLLLNNFKVQMSGGQEIGLITAFR
jgi:FkbM family methyltransferase